MMGQHIGSFFVCELSTATSSYHPATYSFTSGHSRLRVIVEAVKSRKIYLPVYVCETILQLYQEFSISYEYCQLDRQLEFALDITLQPAELLLYINYFGLKSHFVVTLSQSYGAQLVVDNTQAFFTIPDGSYWAFNSARKFFGVADGAYLYTPRPVTMPTQRNHEIAHGVTATFGRSKQLTTYCIAR